MSNNFKDYIILYACVLAGVAILAMSARMAAICVGVDDFIATCIFWLALLLGVPVYLIFERAFEKVAKFLSSKRLKYSTSSRDKLLLSYSLGKFEAADRVNIELIEQFALQEDIVDLREGEDYNYTEIKQVSISIVEPALMLDLDKIRQDKAVQLSNELQERINIAHLYTQHTLAPYLSDEAMVDMLHNINIYATKGNNSELRAIHTKELQYYDLFHYGWNIWNHFGVSQKQRAITIFLKTVFQHDLRNYDTLDGITRKLKMFVSNATIKICDDLTKLSS